MEYLQRLSLLDGVYMKIIIVGWSVYCDCYPSTRCEATTLLDFYVELEAAEYFHQIHHTQLRDTSSWRHSCIIMLYSPTHIQ